ncbi:DNA primase, partial [Caloranaerobacter azorensis DSM 13643]
GVVPMCRKFTFGLVKGRDMLEVLNSANIYENISGLDYLFWQYNNNCNSKIKNEIEYCFKTYAADYIIRFGKKYKNKTLAEIDFEDSYYVENFLHKKAEEINIRKIVDYYLKYGRLDRGNLYNKHEIMQYKKLYVLTNEINKQNSHEIAIALYSLYKQKFGVNLFEKCPNCRNAVNKRWQGIIKRDNKNNMYIECKNCGFNIGIITFIEKQMHLERKEAVYKLAQELKIDLNSIAQDKLNCVEIPNKMCSYNNALILQKKELKEISLKEFGLEDCNYFTSFFKRENLEKRDIEEFNIKYAGKNSKNYLKRRVCFPVKDENGRVVGMICKNAITKKVHYYEQIKKLQLSEELSYEDKQKIIDQKVPYVEYVTNEGFDKSFALYNLDKAVKSVENELFICKMPDDVIRLANELGKSNVVGIMQEEISKGQLYLLYKHFKDLRGKMKIYLCYKENSEEEIKRLMNNARKLQELGFKKIYKMMLVETSIFAVLEFAYLRSKKIEIECEKKELVVEDLDLGEIKSIESKNYYIEEEPDFHEWLILE